MVKSLSMARIAAWAIAIVTIIVSAAVTLDFTPLLRMPVIVLLQLMSLKVIVVAETYRGQNKLSPVQWIAFFMGWPGMRPALFETLPSASLPNIQFVLKGAAGVVAGFVILFLSTILERFRLANVFFITQFFVIVGFSLILHFGILNLLAALWKALGVNADELFRAPYRAASLREFWIKRWNLAFAEATGVIAFRPLRTVIGPANADLAAFLLSGLFYEIVISFSVQSGYGLPMLYFIIQGTAMQLEANSKAIRNMLRDPLFSHLWVMAFLLLPLPLFFHIDFIRSILLPLRSIVLNM